MPLDCIIVDSEAKLKPCYSSTAVRPPRVLAKCDVSMGPGHGGHRIRGEVDSSSIGGRGTKRNVNTHACDQELPADDLPPLPDIPSRAVRGLRATASQVATGTTASAVANACSGAGCPGGDSASTSGSATGPGSTTSGTSTAGVGGEACGAAAHGAPGGTRGVGTKCIGVVLDIVLVHVQKLSCLAYC